MSLLVVSLALLLTAGQPPAEAPAQQAAPAQTSEPAKAEPKMICKYENLTGSRLQKTKVCRPEGETGASEDTKLQRELSKNGDSVDPQRGGFGN
jgi:hypothetical protein